MKLSCRYPNENFRDGHPVNPGRKISRIPTVTEYWRLRDLKTKGHAEVNSMAFFLSKIGRGSGTGMTDNKCNPQKRYFQSPKLASFFKAFFSRRSYSAAVISMHPNWER